jgi:hypothetical protein
MAWQLIIKSIYGDHVVPIAGTETDASAVLAEAEALLGSKGIVRIAERLTLRAEDITAAQIVERHLIPENRRRRVVRSD